MNQIITNPIIYADYSDPDAIRVGEDYFMVASSFCNTPGLPVLHSKDLAHWELINYALPNIPFPRYQTPQHGCGVWAPAIRFHEGIYYIFFPMPDEGIFVTSTKNPWGSWSEPVTLFAGAGWIDPCPFWDEDGRCYMVNAFAKSRIGFKSVLQVVEITPDCTRMVAEPVKIFDGNLNDQVTIEGPKLYKRNGYYYIFAPAGGVKQGWQTVLRAKDIYGPYEYRIVCGQKDTTVNGPHQGAWLDTPSGEEYFLHFQDVYAAGRIVHLQPLSWREDDWPVIGAVEDDTDICGKPVMEVAVPLLAQALTMPSRDEFGLQWQWNANHEESWLMKESAACIRLRAIQRAESISNQPNLYLQKWDAPEFSYQVTLDYSGLQDGDEAGLVHMGVAYAALSVRRIGDCNQLILTCGEQHFDHEKASAQDEVKVLVEDLRQFQKSSTELKEEKIQLGYIVRRLPSNAYNEEGKYTFPIPREEVCLGYYEEDGTLKIQYSFEAKAGRWVGAKFGVYCCNTKEIDGGEAIFRSI